MANDGSIIAVDRLKDYYQSAASVAGLRSVHGALLQSKEIGPGIRIKGEGDPDSRAYRIRQHALTHDALSALTTQHRRTLENYYDARGWPGLAPNTTDADAGLSEDERKQRWHRTQPPPEAKRALGEAAREALDTDELAAAADELGIPKARALVAICKAGGKRLEAIEKASARRWHAAMVSFCRVMRFDDPFMPRVLEPPAKREKGAKRDSWTTPDMTMPVKVYGVSA